MGRVGMSKVDGMRLWLRRTSAFLLAGCALAPVLTAKANTAAQSNTTTQRNTSSQTPDAGASNSSSPVLPRGKKLVLKNGGIQLVREYEIHGDRVRYYDLDNSQWEQIPSALVDWDATKKLEADESGRDTGLAARAHLREQGRRAEPLDIDASFEVAPGVFLPPGEGLFLFDGRSVVRVAQAQTSSTLNKGRVLEQVLLPIPLTKRHTISVDGPHSLLRMRGEQLEFYKRSANGGAPELQLIRAKVHGQSREFERVDELFGQTQVSAKTVPIQSWEMAPGLFRFTLSKDLETGEYGIAEALPGDTTEIYLWDFGTDPPGEPAKRKLK
jgi:hypothetical protein